MSYISSCMWERDALPFSGGAWPGSLLLRSHCLLKEGELKSYTPALALLKFGWNIKTPLIFSNLAHREI